MPPLDLTSTNICHTPACIATSNLIMTFVNLTADPCSDFFQYTCGSWLNSLDVAQRYAQGEYYSVFAQTQNESLNKIVDILEGNYQDIGQHLNTNANGFHMNDQAITDKANFEFIKSYYDVCTNRDLTASLGPTSMFDDFVLIQHQLFPLNATTHHYASILAFFTQQGIVNTLLATDYSMSDTNHLLNDVYFYGPDAAQIPEFEHPSVAKAIASILARPDNQTDNAQFAIQQSQQTGFEFWTDEKIASAAIHYVDLMQQLKNLTQMSTDYSNITLEDAQKAISTVDLLAYLGHLVEGLDASTAHGFTFKADLGYLQKLNTLLLETPDQTLQEYFVIEYLLEKSIYISLSPTNTTNTTMALSMRDWIDKKLSRRAPSTPQSVKQACASDVSKTFPDAIGRYFVLDSFGGLDDKQALSSFVDTLKQSWLRQIPHASFLDEQTAIQAYNKIDLLKPHVAYRNASPDWQDPASLQLYYANQTIDTRSYYKAKQSASLENSKRYWKRLLELNPEVTWSTDGYPEQVNAFYITQKNQIEIPIGILQKPMYSTGVPKYINYGALGSAIGHELVHALDSNGRHYNGSGYQLDWWTPYANAEFEKRQECFIKDFSQYYVTDDKGQKHYINGTQTLGENIADSGGLGIATLAYQEYVTQQLQGKPEVSLPGLEHLTPEQLLYISYGVMRCESIPPKQAYTYDTDEHAPWFTRVNVVLNNSPEFAKAFHCPAGSPMNSKKETEKCKIW